MRAAALARRRRTLRRREQITRGGTWRPGLSVKLLRPPALPAGAVSLPTPLPFIIPAADTAHARYFKRTRHTLCLSPLIISRRTSRLQASLPCGGAARLILYLHSRVRARLAYLVSLPIFPTLDLILLPPSSICLGMVCDGYLVSDRQTGCLDMTWFGLTWHGVADDMMEKAFDKQTKHPQHFWHFCNEHFVHACARTTPLHGWTFYSSFAFSLGWFGVARGLNGFWLVLPAAATALVLTMRALRCSI